MAEHLGVEATNMLEDLTIYSLKMLIFYGLSYTLTNNAFCNQLIAWLTIYIIISQTYVRNAFWDILQALRSWKVGANSTLNCNHVLSHVVVLTSICNVLAPRLSFVITLSPTIVRIILGLI